MTSERRAFSDLGWPLRVVDAECRRHGDVLELWLAVFFQNGNSGGVALVRAPRFELEAPRRRELLAVISTARADASSALADAWGGLAAKARA